MIASCDNVLTRNVVFIIISSNGISSSQCSSAILNIAHYPIKYYVVSPSQKVTTKNNNRMTCFKARISESFVQGATSYNRREQKNSGNIQTNLNSAKLESLSPVTSWNEVKVNAVVDLPDMLRWDDDEHAFLLGINLGNYCYIIKVFFYIIANVVILNPSFWLVLSRFLLTITITLNI